MILFRPLLMAALACGVAFASEPQNARSESSLQTVQLNVPSILPPAMASALDRFAEPGALNPLPPLGPNPQWFVIGKGANVAIAQAPQSVQQCSIPLVQMKIPDKPKFFIGTAPVPKDSPDAMPVLRAPVCPVAPAH
jgi:hypothetical protein